MPNQPLSKQDWATQVVARIIATDAGVIYEALQSVADDTETAAADIPDPKVDAWKALEWMREDETAEAYDAGDSPTDYADFLTTEWDLYGPQGE